MDRVQRALESVARRSFASAVSQLPGAKSVLVDGSLYHARIAHSRALSLFTDGAFLSEHGVKHIAQLGAVVPALDTSIVFILRGVAAAAARETVRTVRALREQNAAIKVLVLTTPRRSKLVEKVLQTAQLTDVPIAPLPLAFLPFDADVVTLDWPEAYRQIVLEGDSSSILAAANALSSLASTLHLRFGTIRSAGPAAAAVVEELLETHGGRYARRPGSAPASSAASSNQSSPSMSTTTRSSSPHFQASDLFPLLPPSRADTTDTSSIADARSDVADTDVQSVSDEAVSHANNNNDNNIDSTAPTLAQVHEHRFRKREVSLILIDRGVDIVTTLLTQWTYEGLLDEAMGLCNNLMSVPVSSLKTDDAVSMLAPPLSGDQSTKNSVVMRLRADMDSIFSQLRDLNYWEAARLLGNVASSVKDYYDARPERETAEIAQVKSYVKGLRDVKSEHRLAAEHLAIAGEISARTFASYEFKRRFEFERELIAGASAMSRRVYICDSISRGESLAHVLRLCCLWSITSGGIDAEDFDFVRKEIVATFGLGVLPLLANLERAGMLARSVRESAHSGSTWNLFTSFGNAATSSIGGDDGSAVSMAESDVQSVRSMTSAPSVSSVSPERYGRDTRTGNTYLWQFSRAALRLSSNDFNEDMTVTPGSADAVAAPYSGYTPLSVRLIEAAMSNAGWSRLPPVAPNTTLLPPGHATVEHRAGSLSSNNNNDKGDSIDTVIVFVGGVTRAEVSAVRLAAQASSVKALIATTAVMGSDEFVLSLNDGTDG